MGIVRERWNCNNVVSLLEGGNHKFRRYCALKGVLPKKARPGNSNYRSFRLMYNSKPVESYRTSLSKSVKEVVDMREENSWQPEFSDVKPSYLDDDPACFRALEVKEVPMLGVKAFYTQVLGMSWPPTSNANIIPTRTMHSWDNSTHSERSEEQPAEDGEGPRIHDAISGLGSPSTPLEAAPDKSLFNKGESLEHKFHLQSSTEEENSIQGHDASLDLVDIDDFMGKNVSAVAHESPSALALFEATMELTGETNEGLLSHLQYSESDVVAKQIPWPHQHHTLRTRDKNEEKGWARFTPRSRSQPQLFPPKSKIGLVGRRLLFRSMRSSSMSSLIDGASADLGGTDNKPSLARSGKHLLRRLGSGSSSSSLLDVDPDSLVHNTHSKNKTFYAVGPDRTRFFPHQPKRKVGNILEL